MARWLPPCLARDLPADGRQDWRKTEQELSTAFRSIDTLVVFGPGLFHKYVKNERPLHDDGDWLRLTLSSRGYRADTELTAVNQ